ncbi:heparan sulfate glucosamine 3-O-sulfotransferase 1-like [Protopterus annectens]|uniref:heparan sulfate glucosamine 3-O-sulfotransferase 1-like n=1 Tax=Protopterus annectens TaxID=7888 RepID=UPI001CF9C820|nr:heparan sulfate glucosamine 3-O-sulfotransferase 1-like [Protopterus annectens]XP_043940237.1 heparan sulfate glucosamine 3-O-sulfotransferase 1-like [Protopterus annectens]
MAWGPMETLLPLLLLLLALSSQAPLPFEGNQIEPTNVTEQLPSFKITFATDALNLTNRLPHAIIIGVRKGGTRALLEMLNIHPDVAVAKSEVHFFNLDDNYVRGLDWYCSQMPQTFPQQLTIEKTPGYFTSLKAPERIHRMNSSIRILLIVRDPAQRVISDYTQILFNRKERNKPYQSLEEILISNGQLNTKYKAIQRSLYDLHMAIWLKFFSLSQIHIVDGDMLISNPLLELKKVEKFLGLTEKIKQSNFYFNQTKGFYCLQSEGHEKCLDSSKGRPHPSINQTVLEQLCTYFKEHNKKFFAMTRRTFNWC